MSPATMSDKTKVLLVDDQRLLREGLRTLLELHQDIMIVGEAEDGVEAEALVERLTPDVVLMDLRMPRRDGVTATRRILARWPSVQVLVLTTFDEDELVFQSLEAGASGYLLKDIGSEALADAVRVARQGGSPLQPSVARKVLRRLRTNAQHPISTDALMLKEGEHLTERELDVLRLLGIGASNKAIAEQLFLTEGTVKNYISAILNKTGLHDRTQAALYAVRMGLGRLTKG